MRILALTVLSLLTSLNTFAQNPPVALYDEGVSQGIPVYQLDCVGSNIACTHSGIRGTITVTGSGSAHGDGANCSAGSYPLGVDADGVVQSCTDATTEIDSAILTHAGVGNAHHAPVTTSGTGTYISLTGQDLQIDPITESDIIDLDHTNSNIEKFWNGTFAESFDGILVQNGANVDLELEQSGGGDLTMQFSDGLTILDCTPTCTVQVVEGTDSSPQENFVYIPQSTKVLTVSTSDWPSEEHIRVTYGLIPSDSFVASDGPYVNQNWNDHYAGTNGQGHLSHIGERLRYLQAIYHDGIGGAGDGSTYVVRTDASPDTVYLKSSSGVIMQMHRHTVTAKDTSAGDTFLIPNESGASYTSGTDLYNFLNDSTGSSMTNKYYNLVLWAVGNKGATYDPLMINLPACSYNSQADAEGDTSGCDEFSIPREFSLESSTGFLIARLTMKHSNGGQDLELVSTVDLRGSSTGSASGGGSSHDPITLAGAGTYLSVAGQVLTQDPITESDISDLDHTGNASDTEVLYDNTGTTDGIPDLTYDGTHLRVGGTAGTTRLQFRDANNFIYTPSASELGMVAADGLTINATSMATAEQGLQLTANCDAANCQGIDVGLTYDTVAGGSLAGITGLDVDVVWDSTDTSSSAVAGLDFRAFITGGTHPSVYGANTDFSLTPTNAITITDLVNFNMSSFSLGAGTSSSITDWTQFRSTTPLVGSNWTLTNYLGADFQTGLPATGTFKNATHLRIEDLGALAKTTNRELFITGAGEAFFRDNALRIGSSTDGQLDFNADTAFKFNTGQVSFENYSFPLADGSTSECLQTNGSGVLSFASCGGSGSPGGSDGQMQYNNSSSFGGAQGLEWDDIDSEFQFDDNIDAVFGTGEDSSIVFDGTDLIVNSDDVGTGSVFVNGEMEISHEGHIGLDGSGPDAQNLINVNSSGALRGALSFVYDYTGGAIGANVINNITDSQGLFLGWNYLTDLTVDHDGAAAYSYYGNQYEFGIAGTRQITQGTYNFHGIQIDDANGKADPSSTGGTVNQYGVRIKPFADFNGSITTNSWGIVSAETIAVLSDTDILFEGTEATQGDTVIHYDSTDTDLEIEVDGIAVMDLDEDLIEAQVDVRFNGKAGSDNDCGIPFMVLWAEESSALNSGVAGGLQFSFGNGNIAAHGMRQLCSGTVARMAMDCENSTATTGVVQIAKNGVAQGVGCQVTAPGVAKGSTEDLSCAVTFSAGDQITFITTTTDGATNGCTAYAYMSYD